MSFLKKYCHLNLQDVIRRPIIYIKGRALIGSPFFTSYSLNQKKRRRLNIGEDGPAGNADFELKCGTGYLNSGAYLSQKNWGLFGD